MKVNVQKSGKNFQAGRLKEYSSEWKKLSSDPFISEMVSGTKIPLTDLPSGNTNSRVKNQIQGNLIEETDKEIEKLLEMNVIQYSKEEEGQVISPIFLVPKSDGTHRLILNLKQFNENVEYEHFKMENLHSATGLMKKDCYMASVDLRHAYYSVPVEPAFTKFLKFEWKGQLFCYTCLPNGLSCCPRYFTKLLKPVYATLRAAGHLSAAFIDDSYLQGDSHEECQQNIDDTVNLFTKLGFVVHREKSVLKPQRKIKYLGFVLNSEEMTVTLPLERQDKILSACLTLEGKCSATIREVAQVIGQLIATFPAAQWGPLYYRSLDKDKCKALKKHKGNFEAVMEISHEGKLELQWWIQNIKDVHCTLDREEPGTEICTDASTSGGWGAVCGSKQTGGRWTEHEQSLHINVLELLAIEYGLKSFKDEVKGKHVKVLTDNTCAVAYIKNMGGSHSEQCNSVARKIWIWCKENNVWLTVAHIPGILNKEADLKSRKFNDDTEWKLEPKIFQKISDTLGKPDIDMFASRLNYQFKPFVSWHPDPEAFAIDAFTVKWNQNLIYLFPPFSQIQRVLKKLKKEEAEGVLILPLWTTACWFPQMLRMLTHHPCLLPKGKSVLQLPHSSKPHPLHKKLQLVAARLSGSLSKHREYMETLSKSCVLHGENLLKDNMLPTWKDGKHFVLQGKLILFRHLYQ